MRYAIGLQIYDFFARKPRGISITLPAFDVRCLKTGHQMRSESFYLEAAGEGADAVAVGYVDHQTVGTGSVGDH